MGFTTKINISENRLVKQDINTVTQFKGSNIFSVPLEERRLGADYENATKQIIHTNILTNFEYFEETGILRMYFTNSEMESSSENIPEINFDEPEQYNILPVFVGVEPYEVEGVEFYKKYTGYEYDLVINDLYVTEYGYSGTMFTSEVIYIEAKSLDYIGDNTVLTVEGNLLADKVMSKPIINLIELTNGTIDKTTKYYLTDIFLTDGELTIDADLPMGQLVQIIIKSGNVKITNGELLNSSELTTNKFIRFVSLGEKKLFIL